MGCRRIYGTEPLFAGITSIFLAGRSEGAWGVREHACTIIRNESERREEGLACGLPCFGKPRTHLRIHFTDTRQLKVVHHAPFCGLHNLLPSRRVVAAPQTDAQHHGGRAGAEIPLRKPRPGEAYTSSECHLAFGNPFSCWSDAIHRAFDSGVDATSLRGIAEETCE